MVEAPARGAMERDRSCMVDPLSCFSSLNKISLSYTSRGALAGTRNSSMGRSDDPSHHLTTELHLAPL